MGNKSSSSSQEGAAESNSRNTNSQNSNETNASARANPGLFAMAKAGYEQLVNSIIRPPRYRYPISTLGPVNFEFCGKQISRNDFVVVNPRGMNIQCSLWGPSNDDKLPCVIYMHGNSSARVEALPELSLVLALGARMLALDFTGSGISDGDYVSLGYFEKDDLQSVIEHIRTDGRTTTIALWGRSMGAATALLHGERDPSIAGMILDSPFSDLTVLAEDIVEIGRQRGLFAPNFVVGIVIKFVRSSIKKIAKFDIKELSPISHVEQCFIPALFVAAIGDDFIRPIHSERIAARYGGEHRLLKIPGDHNSSRGGVMFEEASKFLINVLQIPADQIHYDYLEGGRSSFPWYQGVNQFISFTGEPGSLGALNATYSEEEQLLLEAILLSYQNIGHSETTDDIGMTSERQQNIHSNLKAALGQGESYAATTPTSSPSKVDINFVSPGKVPAPWACPICTLQNDGASLECGACLTPRRR